MRVAELCHEGGGEGDRVTRLPEQPLDQVAAPNVRHAARDGDGQQRPPERLAAPQRRLRIPRRVDTGRHGDDGARAFEGDWQRAGHPKDRVDVGVVIGERLEDRHTRRVDRTVCRLRVRVV